MKKLKELYTKYKELINYLFFGVLTTIVSLVVKYVLLFTIFDASNASELQISIIISWIIACSFAYITNRIWVFKSKSKKVVSEIIKFYSSRIATLGLEMLIMFIFVTALHLDSDIWVVIWTIVSQIAVVVGNYVLSKLIVFKKN